MANLRKLTPAERNAVNGIIGFYDYDFAKVNEFAKSVIPEPAIADLNTTTSEDDATTYLASICWIYLLQTHQNT